MRFPGLTGAVSGVNRCKYCCNIMTFKKIRVADSRLIVLTPSRGVVLPELTPRHNFYLYVTSVLLAVQYTTFCRIPCSNWRTNHANR